MGPIFLFPFLGLAIQFHLAELAPVSSASNEVWLQTEGHLTFRWIKMTDQGKWPPHAVLSSDRFWSAPALAWGKVLGRAMLNYGKYASAWFPYDDDEYPSREVDDMKVLTYQGELDDNGFKFGWVEIWKVNEHPELYTPFVVQNRSPCVLNWGGSSYDNKYLGSCDLKSMTGAVTFDGDEYDLAGKDLESGLVLCMEGVVERSVELTWVPDILEQMVQKTPQEVIMDETHNDASTPTDLILIRKYSHTEGSAYSHEHGWKLGVKVSFHSGLLTQAIAKFTTDVSTEAHGTYSASHHSSDTTDRTYQRKFTVAPHKHVKASVIIYKETMNIPYKAKETFYGQGGQVLGSHEIEGVWQGVATFAGVAKIKETAI